MNRSGHSLSAGPDLDNGVGPLVRLASNGTLANPLTRLQINEVSPSEDDRIAEANLHQAERTSQVRMFLS